MRTTLGFLLRDIGNPNYVEFALILNHMKGSWLLAGLAYGLVCVSESAILYYHLGLTNRLFSFLTTQTIPPLLQILFSGANNSAQIREQAEQTNNDILKWSVYVYSWSCAALLARDIAVLAVSVYAPNFWPLAIAVSVVLQGCFSWNTNYMVSNLGNDIPQSEISIAIATGILAALEECLLPKTFMIWVTLGGNIVYFLYKELYTQLHISAQEQVCQRTECSVEYVVASANNLVEELDSMLTMTSENSYVNNVLVDRSRSGSRKATPDID